MPLKVSIRLLSNNFIFQNAFALEKVLCKLCADYVTVAVSIHVHMPCCVSAHSPSIVYCEWMMGDFSLICGVNICLLLSVHNEPTVFVLSLTIINQSQTQHEST